MIEGIVGSILAVIVLAIWLAKLRDVPVSTWARGLTKQQRAYVRAKARDKGLEPEAIYIAWARKRLAKGQYAGEFIIATLAAERETGAAPVTVVADNEISAPPRAFAGMPSAETTANVDGLTMKVRKIGPPNDDGTQNIEYDSNCIDCGGYVITIEDPVTDLSAASCKACGRPFGTWVAVRALMRDVYLEHQKCRDENSE